ncbi:MAG: diguanylate cyclase [Methylotenera sp. RIFCSPLOWO2_02_FULL_45_14]|nr:MAG: diguanylate cyclase [Methylotenera sp. RIFCSPLOWO2_02_FULL_45_14]
MNAPVAIFSREKPQEIIVDDIASKLRDILDSKRLNAVFQPIIDMKTAEVIGHEGLIRGPADSPLHSPMKLFNTARNYGMVTELEYLARREVLQSFFNLAGTGKVFLNISPDVLMSKDSRVGETLKYIEEIGLSPRQVVIELTENAATTDYQLLRDAAHYYRAMGFEIAIDDLGEGFSGLRMWSELRPDYVKIDQHFIQGINHDPLKLQFVRSIQEIAKKSGARIIAEGIESERELITIRDIGIAFGQGYHITRPQSQPVNQIPPQIKQALVTQHVCNNYTPNQRITVESLVKQTPYVSPEFSNDVVLHCFENQPEINAIPVVKNGIPVGIISRHHITSQFSKQYYRELHGRSSCEMIMDNRPVIIEKSASLHDLSDLMLQSDPHCLALGFIVTENGIYIGMGSGHDLLRLFTQMQLSAARYANPLTLLPGNVPINEHIDGLLQANVSFVTCYFDLDFFKPFNDIHGYKKGDDAIQLLGTLLREKCAEEIDFIGHIGGDDFIVLFQSQDWQQRCDAILERFAEVAKWFYSEEERNRGGMEVEDRQGNRTFQPLMSISIGAVVANSNHFNSAHDVSSAAAIAKKQAKKIMGNSLFIERRQ